MKIKPSEINVSPALVIVGLFLGLIFGVLLTLGVPMTSKQAYFLKAALESGCFGLSLIGAYLREQRNYIVELFGSTLMFFGFFSLGALFPILFS